jgi:hypothetical protein
LRTIVQVFLICLVLWLPCQAARADPHNAEVVQLRVAQIDNSVYLDAVVQFDLSPLVAKALEKGIAIYFVAEAEVYRSRWWWTDSRVGQAARYMRLSYQPLSRRWRLNMSPLPITNAGYGALLNQYYDTLDDALNAVKRMGHMRLSDADAIGDDALHTVMFRFQLDTSQLPRPFLIGAADQSEWNIKAERNARLPVEKTP